MKKNKKNTNVTVMVKPGKKICNGYKQDRSFTHDLNYINEKGEIIHPDRHVGDFTLDKDDYIVVNADNFLEGDAVALFRSKKQPLYKKTNDGSQILKRKFLKIKENKNTGDLSYVGENLEIVAENKTHIQVLIINGDSSKPYFTILRKDEYIY